MSWSLSSKARTLKVMAAIFAFPLLLHLLRGGFGESFSIILGAIGLVAASSLIRSGFALEAAARQHPATVLPRIPRKLSGAVLAGLGAAVISFGAAHDGLLMALLFGGLTAAGCVVAYGRDPQIDARALDEAARAAGLAPKDVRAALGEAAGKIAAIEARAAGLHAAELKARVAAIVDRARGVLGEIERDPKDMVRARRFFATYLDGTLEVIERYAKQQTDLVDTPLDDSFRRVLGTIEQVFGEQIELLRHDQKIDLEVKIEVLETQLRHEGVH